jgi:DNA-binding FadR family transcriptional regulator
MFEPIQPQRTAVDRCADAIRRVIMSGELPPGERLPPERKLAESFGVNRVTVRGALAKLAHSKLLRVRQGSGYVVRDYRAAGGPELISGIAELASADELATIAADLLLVRRNLARGVLAKLGESERVDAAPIREAVDAFTDAVERGAPADELAEGDMGIVAALLEATGSAVLQLCMNPISEVLAQMPALREAIYAEPEGNVIGWRGLLSWLELRDGGVPAGEMVDAFVAELERRDTQTVAKLKRQSKRRS